MRRGLSNKVRDRGLLCMALVSLFVVTSISAGAQGAAQAPPMGWTEWASYGSTATEAELKANSAVLAGLRRYGWRYVMIDAGWYQSNAAGTDPSHRMYRLDGNGRLVPATDRFPSAGGGRGFKPLAAWLHARGLKLGIHVMLGIPRQAVEQNHLIAGASFHASEAADTTQTCAWDREFYAVKDNAAGQAWYDSLAKQYAEWGVDLIKLGCVTEQPFRASEIRQIGAAIRDSGRPMVLSLSPQAPPLESIAFVGRYAQMARVAAEHWDVWTTPAGKSGFPVGLRNEFDLLAKWSPLAAGHFRVDPDVLADGWLGPRPAWGEARSSRLTHDEQRSELTLWVFARAPLIEGANLTRLDSFTKSLLTDRALLDIDQNAFESHPVKSLRAGWDGVRVWEAQVKANGRVQQSFAFFNIGDAAMQLRVNWAELGLAGATHTALDIESHRETRTVGELVIDLPTHGCAVYSIR